MAEQRNSLDGDNSGLVVQARDVHGGVHFHNAPRYEPPDTLPGMTAHFVNRDEQRAAMSARYDEAVGGGRVCLLALLGQDGVGRLSTAVQWHRETPKRFPDGQLHVRLGAADRSDPEAMGERLGELLVLLGIPATELPPTPDGRRTALLNKTSGKRVLLVVENVTSAGQVAWFQLNSPGAAVVVTAEPNLAAGLSRRDYHPVLFAGLAQPHRLDLYRSLLGQVATQVPGLERLAARYSGLPMAIRMIAATLTAKPKRVHTVLRRFEALGLAAVGPEEAEDVGRSFDDSYAAMEEERQTAYRRLAGHPGLSFDPAAAEVLLGEDAEILLEELGIPLEGGRYQLDDLVWRHAASLATPADRDPAAVVRHYLHNTVIRDACLTQRPRTGPLFAQLAPTTDEAEARAWLTRNREALRGAVLLAEEHRLDEETWQLCEALWGLYHQYGHYDDWIKTHEAGLTAARRLRNNAAIMRMAGQLGSAHFAQEEYDRADELFAEQYDHAVLAGDGSGQQSAREWRGKVAAKLGDVARADHWFQESWQATETVVPENARPRTFALLHLQLGRLHGSVEHLRAAQEYFDTTAEKDNQAKAALELGRLQGAAPLLRALELFTATGSPGGQLNTARELAKLDSRYQDLVVELEIRLGQRPG
ncbi:tetratricopeptide (TPR) repeat protein [Crossiella equi]|uniref:Tetratricopeptide (TPR) repeat protein n=1 Tax=Crossiella equi TaxID=130796 RepID=A0ABS5AH38_9PSEU|nr:hypothetical protein [Crossiella equi]MBP2475889.1 tetratricopeptide (TPR) repeat protein [Crossiella equi]